jgi:hypothetical protein
MRPAIYALVDQKEHRNDLWIFLFLAKLECLHSVSNFSPIIFSDTHPNWAFLSTTS